METAVIYARQSFGVEKDSVAVEIQIENCKKWCNDNNIEVIGIFDDHNVSSELYPYCQEGLNAEKGDIALKQWKKEQRTKGRKEYKEGLGKCFEFIKLKHPNYIVVNDKDRLGRTVDNGFLNRFINSFLILNCCITYNLKESHKSNYMDRFENLIEEIKSSVQYGDLVKRRIGSIESRERNKNAYKVCSTAFGVESKNRIITFKERESEMIKFIFNSVLQGKTYSNILNHINNNFKDVLPVYNLHGERKQAKQFYSTNVTNVLNNIVYTGYTRNVEGVIGRAVNVPNPIISLETFNEVQRIMQNRKRGYQKYNLRGNKKKHFLPFSGYLFCKCGRRLTVLFDHGIVYHCINDGNHATTLRMNAENHGQNFYASLKSLFILNVIESQKKLNNLQHINSEISAVEAEIIKLEEQQKARILAISGLSDVEGYKKLLEEGEKKLNEAKNRKLLLIANQKTNKTKLLNKIDDDVYAIMERTKVPEDTYTRLLAETIEKIVVYSEKIHIFLKDGNSFDLPRILVDKRGKKIIPYSDISFDPMVEDNYNDDKRLTKRFYYHINFYIGERKKKMKYQELVSADSYSISLYS